MTEPLAREKVEQACGKLQDLYPHLKNIQLILDGDAGLRRRLAQMTAELDVLTIIIRDNRMTNLRQALAEATYRIDVLEPEHTACQARAAAAEGERDRLENAAEHWHALYMDCAAEKADAAARYGQEIVDLEQGLAAAYLEVRH